MLLTIKEFLKFRVTNATVILKDEDVTILSEIYFCNSKFTYLKVRETGDILLKVGRNQKLMTVDEDLNPDQETNFKLIEKVCVGRRRRTPIKSRFNKYNSEFIPLNLKTY